MPPPFEVKEDGLILKIKVTPKASANRLGEFYHDGDGSWRLKIMVTTVPEAGKATASVVKLLAKHLKIPQQSIEVVAGATHPHKTLRIKTDAHAVKLALMAHLPPDLKP